MTAEMWRIEKRVANTNHWSVVGYAATREEAVALARTVAGGASTGVRICRSGSPYHIPEIVIGV